MAAIDLKKYSGLALSYNNGELVAGENGIEKAQSRIVSIDDIRTQLLNPELTCPEVFYYVYYGVDRKSLLKKKNLKYDMYVIPSNLAGIEYVKTFGYDVGAYPVLIDVAYGFITLIIQIDDKENSNMYVVKLKKGHKYVIPPRAKFVFVNTRQSNSAVSVMYSRKNRLRKVYDDTRGAPYYIIRKNARQEVVQNPAFKILQKRSTCKPEDVYKLFELTAKTPIFKQVLRKYERFKWLNNPALIDWDNLPSCK